MRICFFKPLIVVAIIGITLLYSCKNKLEDINAITFVDTAPVEIGKNVEIIYSDSGKIQAITKAPLYKRYKGKNPYYEMPNGVNVVFYDSVMRVKTHLTSKYAIKYDKKNVMEAKNDVVVVNEKGEQLNTEHLIWDEARRKIYTEVFVKITTADKIFYGDGMDADDSFLKWVIKKPRGTFYINTEKNDTEK
ncbi:MAG: LPS export ABC transporter periplasmic protein LptC [Bacteroidota bacterium]